MNIFADKGKKLILGRQGENLVTAIRFPVKRWIDEFGEGTFLLVHKRSQDKEAYPCVTHLEGDELVWEIYASDVEHVGDGLAQLSLLIGEKVAKSEVFHTSTLRSLDSTENPPEAWQSWIDQVLEATTHYPVPVDGNWHIWVNGQYIDTGVRAEAKDGKDGTNGRDGKDGHTPIKGVDYNDGHTPVMSGGKVGDVSTIYADGTPLISVEDGNSIDVQINGASVVTDGVAEIPIASNEKHGVFKTNGYAGVFMNGDILDVNVAGQSNIDSRALQQGFNRVLTARFLDYAVKAALTDGKGAAYSDAEKAAARARIGICDGELIADITLTEDASYVDILKDTNGNSISLKKAAIFISAKSGNSITWGNVGYWTNGTYKGSTTGASIYAFSSASTDNYSSAFFDCSCGVSRAFSVDAYTNNFGAGMVRCRSNVLYEVNKYDGFRVDSALKAGSTIQVYGLRA